MPPEEPQGLVALDLRLEGRCLEGHGQRLFPNHGSLVVSWYTAAGTPPSCYLSVLDGIAFARENSVGSLAVIESVTPTRIGDRYQWRDSAGDQGLMLILALPAGHTVSDWQPNLIEAKAFRDRVAIFWLLSRSPESSSVEASWTLKPFSDDLVEEVDRLNRAIVLARHRDSRFEYDVALSFAGEDRMYVDGVAQCLVSSGVKVFYDKLEQADLWGRNLYTHLSEVYQRRARFTVMFISKAYAQKRWTNFEREAAQARAFAESREYILPVRIDETDVPGVLPTTAYVLANEFSPTALANLILTKLESTAS